MKNAEAPVEPEIFFAQYEHMEQLIAEHDFVIYRKGPPNTGSDNVRFELVAEYQHYMEQRRPARPKKYEAIDHDMTIWQAARGLRKKSANVFGNGAFILSTDYLFYEFDWQHLRKDDAFGLVVLPNQFIQILRPLVPTTDDFDRRFVEVFAIPEFRSVGGDYSTTFSKVLSYLATFSELTERTAVGILTNEVLTNHLNEAGDEPKKLKELIDNALAEENEKLQQQREEFRIKAQEALDKAATSEALAAERENELRQALEERAVRDAAALEAERKASEAERKATDAERKTTDAERRAAESQQDAMTKAREVDNLRSRMGKDIERRSLWIRILLALVLILIGFGLIFVLPVLKPWAWLDQHPKNLGLRMSASLVVIGAAWMVADPKRRVFAALPLILGAILVLVQMI
jgi:hypothetical protein